MSNNATNLAGSIVENLPVWFNPEHFGIDVVQHPLGAVNATDPHWTALWNEMATADHSRGREVVYDGDLLLPSSVAVDLRDTWTIEGDLWSTVSTNDDDAATQMVKVTRTVKEQQTGAGGGGKLI